jgi:hypothetical protein
MQEWAAKAVPPPPEPPPPDPEEIERLARMSRQERRMEALANAPPAPTWRMQMRVWQDARGAIQFAESLSDQYDPAPGPPPAMIDWSRRRRD